MRTLFISYRQESEAQNNAVAAFAERLQQEGLPVELDQFFIKDHPAGPDEGWPKWCRDRVIKSECVLVIASAGWFQAYDGTGPADGGFGAAEEARILGQSIWREKGACPRMRFVVLPTSGNAPFPIDLDQWHKFDLVKRPDDFQQIVTWVRQKLSISPVDEEQERCVYLAESLLDTDGLREGLAEELTTRNWKVLPDHPYDDHNYSAEAAHDMRRAVAFIQLLQPHRWRGVDRDYVQYNKAVEVGLPTLRFRDLDLDCNTIRDETHRRFLTVDPKIMVRSFDQFKKELFGKLNELWERHQAPPPPVSLQALAKLIRVIDRTNKPDWIWQQAFQWLEQETGIIHDRIKVTQYDPTLLATRQRTAPCHGFLFLCDASALDDPCCSPDAPLEECQRIQLRCADNASCPPVGVIYWPPPPDARAWPKLLNFRPLKLHKVLAVKGNRSAAAQLRAQNALAAMRGFFNDVRGVNA